MVSKSTATKVLRGARLSMNLCLLFEGMSRGVALDLSRCLARHCASAADLPRFPTRTCASHLPRFWLALGIGEVMRRKVTGGRTARLRRGGGPCRRAVDAVGTLPVPRFVERPCRVVKRFRQLACSKVRGAYALVERSRGPKDLAVDFLWIDYADCFREIMSHHFYWCFQVGVTRYEHCAVVFVSECIKKHVCSDVDVRTFFLRLDDSDERTDCVWVGNTHHDGVGKIAAKDAFCAKCLEGTEIYLLAERLAWVVRSREHPRSEVFDPHDIVFGGEDLPRHSKNIQPSVRSAFQGTIIEVESVNIDYSSHRSLSKARAVPCGAALHPFAEAIRGLDDAIVANSPQVRKGVNFEF